MIHLALVTAALAALQPQTPASGKPIAQPPAKAPAPAAAAQPATVRVEGDLFEGEGVVVATGFKFTEGPLFRPDGSLVVCDLSGDVAYTLNPGDDKTDRKPGAGVETLRKPSGRAAGAALDKDGRLVFTQFDGKLTRLEKDGKLTVLAESFEGKSFNMLNDLVVANDGSVYFTDFGAHQNAQSLDHSGVYRLAPDGKVTASVKDVKAPNGVALSADNKTMYVALYSEAKVMAYDLADGSTSNPRVFAEISDPAIKGSSNPDGLKVDAKGNVWTTGAGGIWVLDSKGKRIARILVSAPHNLCFGGTDGRTVFVADGSRIVSVRLKEAAVTPAKADSKTAEPAKPHDAKPAEPKTPTR